MAIGDTRNRVVAEKSAADAFKRSRKGRGNNQLALELNRDALAGVGEVAGRVASAVKGAYATGKEKMGLVGDFIEDEAIQGVMNKVASYTPKGLGGTLGTGPRPGPIAATVAMPRPTGPPAAAVGRKGLAKIAGKGVLKRFTGPAGLLLEGARGVAKVATPPDSEYNAAVLARGEALLEEPFYYQAANALINTADASEEYGAVMEKREKEIFDKKILNGPGGAFPAAWAGGHGAAKPPHTPERVRELLESHRKDEERKDKTKAKSLKDTGWFRKSFFGV